MTIDRREGEKLSEAIARAAGYDKASADEQLDFEILADHLDSRIARLEPLLPLMEHPRFKEILTRPGSAVADARTANALQPGTAQPEPSRIDGPAEVETAETFATRFWPQQAVNRQVLAANLGIRDAAIRADERRKIVALMNRQCDLSVQEIAAERDALRLDLARLESLAQGYTSDLAEVEAERDATRLRAETAKEFVEWCEFSSPSDNAEALRRPRTRDDTIRADERRRTVKLMNRQCDLSVQEITAERDAALAKSKILFEKPDGE